MELNKKENESPLQYHKRIIYGKLVDKTLSDIDYSELAELAYGQQYSSDVARRMFYGSRKTLQLLDEYRANKEIADNPNKDSLFSELDMKMMELKKERQKFYDQRREFSKILSNEARQEHLVDELCKAANNVALTTSPVYDDIIYDINTVGTENDYNEAILVLSDWHYGLKTENIFNEYSTDICVSRLKAVVDTVIKKLMLHKCDKLHIVVLGDLYHGAIHTSARVASEELTCDQLMQVSELLAQTIEVLSKFVNRTIVYTTYGNHARTIPNKKDSIHRDNMERIIPWWLKERFSGKENIQIEDDNETEFIFFSSCGHDICAVHGDNDSVKSSTRLLPTIFHKEYGKNIEIVLLGDKHHRESFEELGVTSLLCGSLCGTDDYANNKRLYSSPSQLLLIINEEDGIDAEYRVKV